MKLDVAIQKVINDFGIEILKESRFVNLLDDYQAFEDMPYAKNILKQIYAENYGAHILNAVQTCDINKANELIAHISSNLGFDEGKLTEIFSAFFTDNTEDNGVSEDEAENEEFAKLRDKLLKIISITPPQIDNIKASAKSYQRDNAFQQLIKMHKDFCNDYNANLVSHKYTDWQKDALSKLKAQIDTIFNECYSYIAKINEDATRERTEMNLKWLNQEIQESQILLNHAKVNKYVKLSNSYFNLFQQIERNSRHLNEIKNNKAYDNNLVNQLSDLQERLLKQQSDVLAFSEDIPIIIKVVFTVIALGYNYLAFRNGWGWLFLTVPLTWYYCTGLFGGGAKIFQYGFFAIFTAIMITIIAPLPWWTILITLALMGGYLYKFREWKNNSDDKSIYETAKRENGTNYQSPLGF